MPFAARHLCLDHPAPPGPGWTALGRFERIERPDAAYPLAPITDTPSPYEVDDLPEAPPPLTYRRIGSRGHAPAYWLIVLAILVLAAESLLYHRRKVG